MVVLLSQFGFQAPLPEPKWNGVFEAINEHVRCPQRISTSIVIGQEDCLVLNVYAPAHAAGAVPVMVFVHGGGYYDGSGYPSLYGPEYLIRHGVLLVTVNYRVNIQGFLCLRTREAPGNAGLKDQVAALKWIRKNIAQFGGDPEQVTVFGESAGAASVSLHLLSPMSKGLFQRAIIQSGSSTAPWTNQYDPINMAHLLAKQFGHNTTDPHQLYRIFINRTYDELIVTRVPRPDNNIIISELLFIPCIEDVIDGVEPFLTEVPYKSLKRGQFAKMPVMIGYNSHEGLLFMASENYTTVPNIVIRKSMPKNLKFSNDRERHHEADRVREFYFNNKNISMETLFELSGFHGDPYFKYPVIIETELIANQTSEAVYSYEFAYSGWLNMGKFKSGLLDAPGASHADELFYLFKPRALPLPQAILEKDMIDKMTTMWSNFAKYGNPTPKPTEQIPVWKAVDHKNPETFVIDQAFSSKPLWGDQSMQMWKEIYDKYRDKDYYT